MTTGYRDRGLQAQRTELAWVRTALGCGALAVLAIHLADERLPVGLAVLIGGAVAAPGLAGCGLRLQALRSRRPMAAPARVAAVRLLVATVAAADLVALGALLR